MKKVGKEAIKEKRVRKDDKESTKWWWEYKKKVRERIGERRGEDRESRSKEKGLLSSPFCHRQAAVSPLRISKGCLAAVVLCRRTAVDWSSPLSCCTVSKPLRHRSSLLHHRRSSPWLYPLSPDIKSGHGFVVGDEGYRQDSDIQKVKLSREALTQLSKLVESRVSTGLDTILTLFYSFWNWGCYQVRLNTIYHKSSICISRGCGWQHLGPFINLRAFYLCGISLAATLAFWVKLRGKELWIGMTIFSKFKQHPPPLPVTYICQFAPGSIFF
ncbi:uncharacterized protein LOC110266852 [Arachis ipaensis]|uniref:uncharacterized protein LOC110266852 n=1 Tax=Arachis ipaensis TaxID=130454 RepID=UPI000A2B0F9F|nr:uncharacterized protein LOC110266852 [Arachis ipaensis]